jgi:hypothetical protein
MWVVVVVSTLAAILGISGWITRMAGTCQYSDESGGGASDGAELRSLDHSRLFEFLLARS